jgi:hypothetical protein
MATRGAVTILINAKDNASKVVKGVAGGLKNAFGSLTGFLKANPIGTFLASLGIGAAITQSIQKLNEYEASVRKLAGSAKVAGVPLDFLQYVAKQARKEFGLSTIVANEFASEMAKLAAKAGDLELTQKSLKAFLNLGAARGLSAEATLQAVGQAILGIDEGTDKLFGANPSVLYERYAASIGTTAGKLSDMEKAYAIVNAAVEDATKVGNAYNDYLEGAQGKQDKFNIRLEETQISIGRVFRPVLLAVLKPLGALLGLVTKGIVAFKKLDAALGLIAASTRAAAIRMQASINDFFGLDDIAAQGRALADTIMADAEKKFKEKTLQIQVEFPPADDPAGESYDEEQLRLANERLKAEQERLKKIKEQQRLRKEAEKAALAEAEAAFDNELKIINARTDANRDTIQDLFRLIELEEQYKAKIQEQGLSLSQLAQYEDRLAAVQAAREKIAKQSQDAEAYRLRVLNDLKEEAIRRARRTAEDQGDTLTTAIEIRDEGTERKLRAEGNDFAIRAREIQDFIKRYQAALVTLGATEQTAITQSQELLDVLLADAKLASLDMQSFGANLKHVLGDSVGSFVRDGITGFNDLSEAGLNFLENIQRGIADLLASLAQDAILGWLFKGISFTAGQATGVEITEGVNLAAEGGATQEYIDNSRRVHYASEGGSAEEYIDNSKKIHYAAGGGATEQYIDNSKSDASKKIHYAAEGGAAEEYIDNSKKIHYAAEGGSAETYIDDSKKVNYAATGGLAQQYIDNSKKIHYAATGGPVRGLIKGPGGPKDDKAGLFALSNKEYVVNAKATQAVGAGFLDFVNSLTGPNDPALRRFVGEGDALHRAVTANANINGRIRVEAAGGARVTITDGEFLELVERNPRGVRQALGIRK